MKKISAIILALSCVFISCTKDMEKPVLNLKGESEVRISNLGGEAKISFETNQPSWTFDLGGAEWLTAEKSGNILLLAAGENLKSKERSTTVTILAPEAGDGQLSIKVNVIQARTSPFISLEAQKPLAFSSENQTLTIPVRTTFDTWEIEVSEQDWLTAEISGNSVIVSVEKNSSEFSRTAKLTVYAPNKRYFEQKDELEISQNEVENNYSLEDLSAGGKSNCYLISHKGQYCFDATVRGNGLGCEGLDAPKSLSPAGAKLVWQTKVGMITSVSYKDGKIYFDAGGYPGNALIAATNSAGTIIWSWHIWRPETPVQELECVSGDKVMNLNLGAITENYESIDCLGLHYQWGRKDPFPGSPIMSDGTTYTKSVPVYDMDGNQVTIGSTSMQNTTDNSLSFSISHPTTCISNNAQKSVSGDWLLPKESNAAYWGNPHGYEHDGPNYNNRGTKTFYDPCPAGWRVPPISTMLHVSSTGGMIWASGDSEGVMDWATLGAEAEFQGVDINKDGLLNLLDFTNGWWLYLDKEKDVYSFFPAATRWDANYAMFMGSMVGLWGSYWTNSPDNSDSYYGEAWVFGIMDYNKSKYEVEFSPISAGPRANGFNVRCIKE